MDLGLGDLWAWLKGQASEFMSAAVSKFVAWKAALFTMFTVILPTVLNNLFYDMLQKAMELVTAQAGTHVQSITLQLTGCTAWVAIQLKLPECIALLLGALALKVAFRMIPIFKIVA